MYKTLSNNLQKTIGIDTARKVGLYRPRTRPEHRSWWYTVIAHHHAAKTSVKAKYGKKFPSWLAQEVDSFTPEKWLAHWDRKTGKPFASGSKQARPPATQAPTIRVRQRPRQRPRKPKAV